MEKWFMIGGWNQKAQYGFGTRQQAERFADVQNENRDVNFVHVYDLEAHEVEDLRLEDNTEAFNFDDWEREYNYQQAER